jgi:IS5 family transposase
VGQTCQVDPWEQFEDSYRKNLSANGVGNPALSVRMALAALIIKEELGVSDRECVQQITENPYLMYFCGFKAFIKEPPFDPSMMVHFRKRFPADVLVQVNNAIAKKVAKKKKPPKGPNEPPMSKPGKKDKKADNSTNNAPPQIRASCWWMPHARRRTSHSRRTSSCSTRHVRKVN